MKVRKLFAALVLALMLFCQAMPLMAAVNPENLVNDEAGILTVEERDALEARAQELFDEYGLEARILIVPSMGEETDAYEFAKTQYTTYGFGAGEEKSGILLMLSMEARDYALIAHGEGNEVLTDYGNEEMANSFLGYFANDNWSTGFNDYLYTADKYCYSYYVEGKAYDEMSTTVFAMWCMALFGAPFIGWIAIRKMKADMQTAKEQTNAENYVDLENAFKLTNQSDDFIYTQTIVTKRPKSDGGSSGGTSVDSGGFSGSSGKF